jgi:hypothetical protein
MKVHAKNNSGHNFWLFNIRFYEELEYFMHNTAEPMEALKYMKNKSISKFKLISYLIVSFNVCFPVLYVIYIISSIIHIYDSEVYELMTFLMA